MEGSLLLLCSQESLDYEGRGPWDLRALATPVPSDTGQEQQKEHMYEPSEKAEHSGEPWVRGETSRKSPGRGVPGNQ